MQSLSKTYFALMLCLITGFNTVLCQSGLEERFEKVNGKIQMEPESAELYLQRGELFLHTENYKAALKDFKKCKRLGADHSRRTYGESLALYKLERYEDSMKGCQVILNEQEDHPLALRLLGRALEKQGRYSESAEVFESLIQSSRRAIPEHFLAAAKSWTNSGRKDASEKAIGIIYIGIKELGALPVFLAELRDISLSLSDYPAALRYQNEILAKSESKEEAYFQRAKIYAMSDAIVAARLDLLSSREIIASLSLEDRHKQSVIDLGNKIEALLMDLKSKSP